MNISNNGGFRFCSDVIMIKWWQWSEVIKNVRNRDSDHDCNFEVLREWSGGLCVLATVFEEVFPLSRSREEGLIFKNKLLQLLSMLFAWRSFFIAVDGSFVNDKLMVECWRLYFISWFICSVSYLYSHYMENFEDCREKIKCMTFLTLWIIHNWWRHR